MRKLLASEFKRIIRYKSLWVVFAFALGVIVFILIDMVMNPEPIVFVFAPSYLVDGNHDPVSMIYRPTGVNAINLTVNISFFILLPILFSILIASEYPKGTLRDLESQGYKKWTIYLSRLLSSWIVTFAIVSVLTLINAALASVLWGFSDGNVLWGRVVAFFFMGVLVLLALTSLAVFISSIIRRTGGAVALNILFITLQSSGLLSIILPFGREFSASFDMTFADIFRKMHTIPLDDYSYLGWAALACLGYIIVTTAFGMFLIERRKL